MSDPTLSLAKLVAEMPHEQFKSGGGYILCRADCWRCKLEAALAAARKQIKDKPIHRLTPVGWACEKEVREWVLKDVLGEPAGEERE